MTIAYITSKHTV